MQSILVGPQHQNAETPADEAVTLHELGTASGLRCTSLGHLGFPSADHLRLARDFTAVAKKQEAEAKEHQVLALSTAGIPGRAPARFQWRQTRSSIASISLSTAGTPPSRLGHGDSPPRAG
jgi:hypothetical protein